MRRHFLVGLALLVVGVASHGCGGSPTSPSFSQGSLPAPAPATVSVTGLRIAGASSFSAIGETSQLTAIATLSDGTTTDVTSDAQWLSIEPQVVGVSSTGVLTVVGFGGATVRALYVTKRAEVRVVATPPGTFVAVGRVREPGQGGINGVRVIDPQSGMSTLTYNGSSGTGQYSIGGLRSLLLSFEKEAYESRQDEVEPNVYTEVALQRIIRLTAGGTVTPPDLAPHDMAYMVGSDRCEPCRLIRIVAPTAGTLRLSLRWGEARVNLSLWVPGGSVTGAVPELTTDVPVSGGEVVVYAGVRAPTSGSPQVPYVPFTLDTSMK